MKFTLQKKLTSTEIQRLSSVYLDSGVKQEAWKIAAIEIDGPVLRANIRMTSTCASITDEDGFHLTIFSTMEFLSQLANIFFHLWAGYEEKTREVWMRECNIQCKRPIRDKQKIMVRLEVKSLRRSGENALGIIHFEVTDSKDGRFEGKLKGVLS
jgi:hypothetical protein